MTCYLIKSVRTICTLTVSLTVAAAMKAIPVNAKVVFILHIAEYLNIMYLTGKRRSIFWIHDRASLRKG